MAMCFDIWKNIKLGLFISVSTFLIFGIIRLPHQTYKNRRDANLMINQMNQNENIQNKFLMK